MPDGPDDASPPRPPPSVSLLPLRLRLALVWPDLDMRDRVAVVVMGLITVTLFGGGVASLFVDPFEATPYLFAAFLGWNSAQLTWSVVAWRSAAVGAIDSLNNIVALAGNGEDLALLGCRRCKKPLHEHLIYRRNGPDEFNAETGFTSVDFVCPP